MGLLDVDRKHIISENKNIDSSAANVVATYTCPANKSAIIRSYWMVATGGATVSARITRASSNFYDIGTSTGGTQLLRDPSYIVLLGTETFQILVTITAGATTASAYINIEEMGN